MEKQLKKLNLEPLIDKLATRELKRIWWNSYFRFDELYLDNDQGDGKVLSPEANVYYTKIVNEITPIIEDELREITL